MKRLSEAVEKLLLLLLPYFLLVSLCYYWGYWGLFDIDAISYYGVQDLIKGFAFTSPAVIGIGLLAVFGPSILSAISDSFDKVVDKYVNKYVRAILFALTVYGLLTLFTYNSKPDTAHTYNIDWVTVSFVAVGYLLSFFISGMLKAGEWIGDSLAEEFAIKHMIRLLIMLPICSYASGRNDAKHVVNGMYFNYTQLSQDSKINESPSKKVVFKYLGKAGDFYFFLSVSNKEKRVVSAQTIPSFAFYSYNDYDPQSVSAYKSLLHQ